ncbi:MAG TPA: hypothetical protein V6D26_09630, partial [Stenomitos sp.]
MSILGEQKMSVLTKQSAYTLLNLKSVEELNRALTELANHLQNQGKEVPDEMANSTAHESISKAHLTLLRDYKNGKLSATALPQPKNNELTESVAETALTVTDDDVLELAETTGVDLDVVMSAAAHVEDLEALVKWVEAYQELESEQAIKESARQQFELDQLRKKESELAERLNSALTKSTPNVKQIRQRLGVTVPQKVTTLGKWNGKVNDPNEPDFLKKAR